MSKTTEENCQLVDRRALAIALSSVAQVTVVAARINSCLRNKTLKVRTRTLDVAYTNSGEYRYFDVGPEVYAWLVSAESKGKFVNGLVKERYRYERLGSGVTAEYSALGYR